MVFTPIYGTGKGGNYYTGKANPVTGQYQLNALPPDCSATQGAPCIPNGTTPHPARPLRAGFLRTPIVSPSPSRDQKLAGQLGSPARPAYRMNDKTVIRAAYSRFFDEWADITQLSQNFGGNWPAVDTIQNNGLNAMFQR